MESGDPCAFSSDAIPTALCVPLPLLGAAQAPLGPSCSLAQTFRWCPVLWKRPAFLSLIVKGPPRRIPLSPSLRGCKSSTQYPSLHPLRPDVQSPKHRAPPFFSLCSYTVPYTWNFFSAPISGFVWYHAPFKTFLLHFHSKQPGK